ncbi:ABC transporter permease [Plantactinospora sp. KBS50]|uniref:ABC transporter permease n=1 Tax=Plantactinospora sp. KBS50 TaxID=2024580 RepID=UPI000BAACBEB|nr:ABC transporter permease [Plantactinospora sp. KBS50]ASW55566.1 ABC transporter permease [Plantactinospora sp. KBS50]
MRVLRYLLRRVVQLVPAMLAIVVIEFTLIHLAPGDVARIMAGDNQDPEYIASVREQLGLDQPLPRQFLTYFLGLLRGDLGESSTYGQPVTTVIGQRLWPTVLLLGTSLVLAAVLGTVVGTWLSRRLGSTVDTVVSLAAVGSYSIPVFWFSLLLILVFGVWLHALPTSGMISPGGQPGGWSAAGDIAAHMVLPVAALSSVYLGQYLRLSRTTVHDTLQEDYVKAARAAGFSERTIMFRFALRNALLPIVTVFGLHMGLVLAGAVLTETVFSWPGLGSLLYQAILARDIPLVTGTYFIVGLTVLVATVLTDLCYSWLDPRVEYR